MGDQALRRPAAQADGSASGCNVWAAMKLAQELPPSSRVVTLLCDGAERYMSKFPVADISQELP